MAATIAVIVALLVVAAVNFAKGKIGWGVCSLLGIFLPFAIGASIRLARPDSWWARRFYDREKRAQAEERFSEERHGSFETPLEAGHLSSIGEKLRFECELCGEVFEARDVAEHHVQSMHSGSNPPESVAELSA